jgi:uncharacterized damage-inducible protein DinB
MSIADVLLEDYDVEISNTRRTLERLPEDEPEWTPHEKSFKLGKLAMHCATMPLFGYYIFEDEGMDMAASARPHPSLVFTTVANALAQLDENAAKCRARLAVATDKELSAKWKFSLGEQVISNETRVKTFRMMCFNHLIHHTSQLGVYLRLLDLPVPALYGPSADERWAPK